MSSGDAIGEVEEGEYAPELEHQHTVLWIGAGLSRVIICQSGTFR